MAPSSGRPGEVQLMEAAVQTEAEEQLVIFELAGESYGVDISSVQRLIPMCDVTRIPQAPPHVAGVIDLRGEILPVLDLRLRFGLDTQTEEERKGARIMVTEIGEHAVGMIVDGVSEVLRIARDQIEPPSVIVTGVSTDYIRGVGKLDNRLIVLLALDRVLGLQELKQLQDAAAGAF